MMPVAKARSVKYYNRAAPQTKRHCGPGLSFLVDVEEDEELDDDDEVLDEEVLDDDDDVGSFSSMPFVFATFTLSEDVISSIIF